MASDYDHTYFLVGVTMQKPRQRKATYFLGYAFSSRGQKLTPYQRVTLLLTPVSEKNTVVDNVPGSAI